MHVAFLDSEYFFRVSCEDSTIVLTKKLNLVIG